MKHAVPKRPIIVGITGPSGSGKSSLAEWLRHALGKRQASLVQEDAYYHSTPSAHSMDFDTPMALDHGLLLQQLDRLCDYEPVDMPCYDFATHQRQAAVQPVTPAGILLLDGLFLLYSAPVRRRLDFSVFVDTPPDICLVRRLRRDRQSRGRSTDDILRQYEQTVRPGWRDFVAPSRQWADLVVDGEVSVAETGKTVLARLQQRYPGST